MIFNKKLAEKLDLTKAEISALRKLNSPQKIQDFLGGLPFNFEKNGETLLSPRRLLQAKKCHCLEGAIFAALTLWLHGHKPLLVNMRSRKPDFEHVLAVFQKNGFWGAISKTNHSVLRYRDPVYKNPRELMMSYFHEFFMNSGVKTLLGYNKPFDLRKIKNNWATSAKDLWEIDRALNKLPYLPYLPKNKKVALRKVDRIERIASNHVEWR